MAAATHPANVSRLRPQQHGPPGSSMTLRSCPGPSLGRGGTPAALVPPVPGGQSSFPQRWAESLLPLPRAPCSWHCPGSVSPAPLGPLLPQARGTVISAERRQLRRTRALVPPPRWTCHKRGWGLGEPWGGRGCRCRAACPALILVEEEVLTGFRFFHWKHALAV